MNHHRKPQLRIQNPAYRQALTRLDAALEKNTLHDNTRIIKLMRDVYFKDVRELAAQIKLPER